MRFCVFLGSQTGNREQYSEEARKMGRYLAANNIGIVYGGASIGLMGELARAATEANGEVIGVIPRRIMKIEIAADYISEMIYVDTLEERENIMFDLADAFIALPGGFGTLEELFTVQVWNMLNYHSKPVGLLNVQGYYDRLTALLNYQNEEGFISDSWLNSIIIHENVEQLINTVRSKCAI